MLKWLFNKKNAKTVSVADQPATDVSIDTMTKPQHNSNKYTLTLFLDFEGVLHTGLTKKYYYISNLFKILDLFPYMNVVISSEWRRWAEPGDIVKIFGEYSHRITGTTTKDYGYPNKQAEINKYVEEHNLVNYIAIDDNHEYKLFDKDCPWLFKTNIIHGLDDDATSKFMEFIENRQSAGISC